MKDFNKVAIVNLCNYFSDYNYGVALYDDEASLIKGSSLVIIDSSIDKDLRNLAYVQYIIPAKYYNGEIVGQVIGVVNMDAYNKRGARNQ